jgi:uncharacterized protein (UPF0261 family)
VARTIAVLATLDTKAAEAAELQRLIAARGWPAAVIDVGLAAGSETGSTTASGRLGGGAGPNDGHRDVSAAEIATLAGARLEELRAGARRDAAMKAMGTGAGRVLARWHERGELAGAIGIGGNQGTAIAAIALRALPIGVPKLIVSTVASGDVRPYVGDGDVAMLFSVGDLLGGPNRVTGRILANAAGAIAGMAGAEETVRDSPAVAITAFGNTHQAAVTAMERLAAAGRHVVPFHASGSCGSAMERLIDEGVVEGVLDLTTHELLAELYPDDIYAPVRAGRLTAAGRAGIPQVVLPGGLEYFCLGPPETVPAWLRDRPTHHHNPYNLNIRARAGELADVGREMARRLNAATGPTAVLVPTRGWSEVGSPGGPLHDPDANRALTDELRAHLRPEIELREVETTINDPAFARRAADTLLELLAGEPVGAEMGSTRGREPWL